MLLNTDQVNLIGQVFESYVLEYHKNDILHILREQDDEKHYPIVVDALTLFETNMEIGEYFNAFPNEVLPIFDNALRRAAVAALQPTSQNHGVSIKQNLHARISGKSFICVIPHVVDLYFTQKKKKFYCMLSSSNYWNVWWENLLHAS